MKQHPSVFINGQWLAGEGPEFSAYNPFDSSLLWQGCSASDIQIDQAVSAAANAFHHWSALTLAQRSDYLRHFSQLLEQHQELLADTIGQETGKPLWEATAEVAAMRAKFELSLQAYTDRTGYKSSTSDQLRSVLRHKPHGVLAVFGPYNFPGHLPNGHIMPALLAGNTLVFKPSEYTPRTAELMVHLWQKAELPDGVLNMVQGTADTGRQLSQHPRLDGLCFTGSASVGCQLHRQFAGHPGKILALEMGGNNPLVVGPTQQIRAASALIIQSAYLTAGQRCTCARRLLVPAGSEGDKLLAFVQNTLSQLKPGRYDQQPAPFMGPVISAQARQQLLTAQEHLMTLGARPLLAMQPIGAQGALLTPGLLDVSDIRSLPDEEYFGPLLQVQRYQDFDQAIELANQTAFGLSAGLISDNEQLWPAFVQRIRAGIINFNRPLTGASSALPFGGTGLSGNLRPTAAYAADYCAYPVASMESDTPELPDPLPPGLTL